MHDPVEDLSNLMRRYLPQRMGRCEIWTAPPPERAIWMEDGGVYINIRLTFFDSDEDASPQDVKEQEICLGEYARHSPERWNAYLEGQLRALPAILTAFGEHVDIATLFALSILHKRTT